MYLRQYNFAADNAFNSTTHHYSTLQGGGGREGAGGRGFCHTQNPVGPNATQITKPTQEQNEAENVTNLSTENPWDVGA